MGVRTPISCERLASVCPTAGGLVPHPFHSPIVKWVGDHEPQPANSLDSRPSLTPSFWRKEPVHEAPASD